MQQFAALFQQLDQTTKTNTKVAALAHYFELADEKDKLWTVAILSHRRPKRTVNTTLLRTWAAEMSEMPQWLFEESYHVVGDLAETIARMLPPPEGKSNKKLSDWIDFIKDLGNYEEAEKRHRVRWAWDQLDYDERFIFNKLITGGFRIGVSQKLMVRALSKSTGIEENTLA
ncbi:MAG: ATP-dependent DNA ligase, partial [Bacteroidota bacterium]